jgi:hypothetical protein
MKAKTNRQKQTVKKTPQKKRKLRTDASQKKPVFAEFTNSWGLAGFTRWDTEAKWFSQKIENGKLLHPLLVYIIKELQHDYQCSVLQFFGSMHNIRESDVSNKEIWKLHQIHLKQRNREPLDKDEQRDLKVWATILADSLSRMEELGKIIVGAVACGDIALFEHLILIMQSLRKETDKPAKPKAQVVEKAYDSVVLRRHTELLQKSGRRLKGTAARLAVARAHDYLLKQIQLPDLADVDDEITKIPELLAIAPDWMKSEALSRHRQIERVCKQTGRELSGTRTQRST